MHSTVDERIGQAAELLGRQGADVGGVDGTQLKRVKDGGGLGNAGRVPNLDHFLKRENFLLALGGPAQQQQIVQHSGRQVAFGHQVLIAGVAIALGQLILGVLHNRRAVDVDGLFPAESLVQQVVLGGGGQILAAADDVGNAHQVVIHHVGEVVGGHAVGLNQNLVVQFLDVDLDMAVDHIVETGHAGFGDLLADDVRLTGGQLGVDLLLSQVAAVAVVVGHLTGGALGLVHLVQAVLGAEAVVSLAFLDELLGILFEHAHALALHIGADGAADVGAFVPGQAGGAQRAIDDVGSALDQAALVGILDTQNERTIVMACLQVSVQCGAQVADVHIARGRRRKPGTNVRHGENPFILN